MTYPEASSGKSEIVDRSLTARIGIPSGLSPGVLGVTLFMVGEGLEVVWISDYFTSVHGFSLGSAGWIITALGIAAVLGAYVVAPMTKLFPLRTVMAIGVALFAVADVLFIAVALPSGNYWLILFTYALRGVATPLYGQTFLVWLYTRARGGREGLTISWYWFAQSFGLQILGNLVAGTLLAVTGAIATLWIGAAIAVVGGMAALAFCRDPASPAKVEVDAAGSGSSNSLSQVFLIAYRRPAIGLGGLVKVANLAGILAFFVFYVPYLTGDIGLPIGQAVLLFSVLGISGVPGNLVWGWLSDKIGWANTVQWVACVINAIAVVLLYYVPQFVGPNFIVISGLMLFWGVGTSAFVALSALVPAIAAEDEKADALGVMNVAAALAQVVGPAAVAVLVNSIGYGGVTWVVFAMYVCAFFIMFWVQVSSSSSDPISESRER